MIDFIETPRYSALQDEGSGGGPGFKTFIGVGASAFERRIAVWDRVRARYNLASGVRDASDIRLIMDLFLVCRGRAVGFRYKDPADYSAVDSPIGTGDGSTTIFQLKKRYTYGSNTFDRICRKTVAGSYSAKINGVSTGAFAVDHTTGKLTFTVAPIAASVLTASFEFDVPVRFDTDELKIDTEEWDQLSIPDIPVIELRLED